MRIKTIFKIIRHLPKTIYFNIHYLGFKTAFKLPIIFVSKVRLAKMKGALKINGPISTGMIILGGNGNVLYRQASDSIVWCNYGGSCEFSKKVEFSDGCALEIGQSGTLIFEENVFFGPMVRIACYDKIRFGANSRIAWESIVLDTDFHSTIDIRTGNHSKITKPINIGKNNWIGIRCFIMKGTTTPDFCIASAYSMLNKSYEIPSYSLLAGIPAKFIKEGLYRDLRSHVNADTQRRYDKLDNKA